MDEAHTDTEVRRTGRTMGVGNSLAPVAAAGFARAGFTDPRLVTHWADIAGGQMASMALPIRLSGGVLTLKAEPGANTFLSYETKGLADRINAYLGRKVVSRIKIVVGSLPPPETDIPRRVAAPTVADGDPVLRFDGPEGLRTALEKLARARKGRLIR